MHRWIGAMLVLLALSLGAAARQPACGFFERTGPCPTLAGQSASAMAHDAARERTVVFGVNGFNGYTGETWEWDGSSWAYIAPVTSMEARAGHAMVYDSLRARVLVLGGFGYSFIFDDRDDVWSWDGQAWTRLAEHGYGQRSQHVAAYDAARDRVVLYGGQDDNGALADTWEWNGAAWAQSPASGPGPRINHSMVYDAARQRTVLFGGQTTTGLASAAVWEYDGSAWTERPEPGGPSARYRHSMHYDPVRQRTVVIGGVTSGVTDLDVWEWDGKRWTRLPDLNTPPRVRHLAAYDTARSEVVVHAGAIVPIGFTTFDTATIRDGAWTQRHAGAPFGRRLPSLVYDSARARLVMFGGLIWELDLFAPVYGEGTWELGNAGWTRIGASPDTYRGWAVAHHDAIERTVLFGGEDTQFSLVNDTWAYDGAAWTDLNIPGPPPRTHASMAYDPQRQRLVLFGGWGEHPMIFGDTWEFDGAEWAQVASAGPPARLDAAMCYDASRRVVLLHGGAGGSATFTDTWAWDGSAWTLLSNNGPTTGFLLPSLAFDPARGVAALIVNPAGAGGDPEIWEWDGIGWSLQAALTQLAGHFALSPLVYDPGRGAIVSWGLSVRQSVVATNQLWEWRGVTPSGDVTGDGAVNFADLNAVLSNFGETGAIGSLPGDANRDGMVNFADLNLVLAMFGRAC